MSKKENFCVPMYRVMDDAAPLVETVITDKHGNKHRGLFVLDSCSTHNFLSERFDDFAGEAWKEEGPIEVNVMDQEILKGKPLPDGTIPVADAILGSSFIGAEGWILDFGAKVIYKRKCCA